MRLVIQRVKEASVKVEGEIIGKIGPGLLVLLGIHKDDTSDLIAPLVDKIMVLRIFEDEAGKMNLSVQDIDGEILIVSQFTLYGNCKSGRRPDFFEAAPSAQAKPLYEQFIQEVEKRFKKPQTGQFGAYMEVGLVNDGPVTLII
jgi:D-tyrosyl-tRNA(Tyr) deacylase